MQARRPAIGATASQASGENPVAKGQQTLIRLLGDTLVGSIGRVSRTWHLPSGRGHPLREAGYGKSVFVAIMAHCLIDAKPL